jgi:alpha-D-ribose 1-methylphosphonate 5-triphosphate synthase subunit PhnH
MNAQLSGGFADPVIEAQAAFRAAMLAMSRPGRPIPLRTAVTPPAPLSAEAATVALTLLDNETTAWLDDGLRAGTDVGAWLRFHTGARLVEDAEDAAFALIGEPRRLQSLNVFARGTPDYPDRAATLVLQVEGFASSAVARLRGPGIRETIDFAPGPLPPDFWTEARADRASYPCGVDILFVAHGQVAGLPRSVRIELPEIS